MLKESVIVSIIALGVFALSLTAIGYVDVEAKGKCTISVTPEKGSGVKISVAQTTRKDCFFGAYNEGVAVKAKKVVVEFQSVEDRSFTN